MTISANAASPQLIGEYQDTITGRFRHITPTQLAMAWWCYLAGHISRFELRVWFALHEMAERRWVCARNKTPPQFQLAELRRLVGGGGGGGDPDRPFQTSVNHLEKLRLVSFSETSIRFATSPDQLAVEKIDGLFDMLRLIPNLRRKISFPRRLLRALAAGFGKAVTATVLAHVFTSLYAHRENGVYRVDGRCKASWIAETFGVSERAVKEARKRLIELGWLTVLETPQWALNKWGAHTKIDVDWKAPQETGVAGAQIAQENEEGGRGPSPTESKSAPPQGDFEGKSAPPCLKPDALPKRKTLENQTPAMPGPGHSGFSISSKKKGRGEATDKVPTVTDIQPEDLREVDRTTALYRDACTRGKAHHSEHGRLQFFSLVERARARAHDPCRLLAWLLREQRFDYITASDEDTALARIKRQREQQEEDRGAESRPSQDRLGAVSTPPEDVCKYMAVMQTVEKTRTTLSPQDVACVHLGWDEDRWNQAEADYLGWQQEKAIAGGCLVS